MYINLFYYSIKKVGFIIHTSSILVVSSWAEPDRPWREVGLQAYLGFVLAPL